MRSISHWGIFESYDKEVRIACSPEYARSTWQPQESRVLGKYFHQQSSVINEANALYQKNNFGKLD